MREFSQFTIHGINADYLTHIKLHKDAFKHGSVNTCTLFIYLGTSVDHLNRELVLLWNQDMLYTPRHQAGLGKYRLDIVGTGHFRNKYHVGIGLRDTNNPQ